MRSAEPSAPSRVASESVPSVDNAVLNPQATVFRPQPSDVVRSAVTWDFPDKSTATDVIRSAVTSNVPNISNATDVVRASLSDATLINVSESNAVNVRTPPEAIASLNVYPTLANAPTQADVIALLNHFGAHIKNWSGEWGQAQVIEGTTSELVVMMRDISADSVSLIRYGFASAKQSRSSFLVLYS